uniref:Spi-C transcription factor (Spi-1/PU.1 related) n=1 Tax=Poecilia reticulata TaxID=8081 RepID=A0A3P9QHZ8_POERE
MMSLDPDINQHFQDAIDVIQQHSHNAYCDPGTSYYISTDRKHMSYHVFAHQSDIPAVGYDWSETQHSWPQVIPDVSLSHSVQNDSPHFYSIIPPQRNSKGRKKLRLYEYLHEALNDPSMGDSIQWTDSSSGTFHFISKNKEKLAECWGQRKGNRKTMTYQKMARALRNYSRTGEIVKVRRKLTYQFNPDILLQESPSEQSYPASAAADWHGWYGHYQLQEDYDLAASFTSHSSAKL